MKCPNCQYFITCTKASEEIKECESFKKIDINVDIERIENND